METVIYHKNCRDGFGAALAAWYCLGDRAKYIACQYGDSTPPVDPDGRVFIVDFSFPKPLLLELSERCHHVVVLDHHKTAQDQLAGFIKPPAFGKVELPGCYAHFDMAKSGAVLAWEYFNPDSMLPKLLEYIQDRDLWQWKLPMSREISAALEMEPMEFQRWENLLHQPGELIETGSAILRYQANIVEKAVRSAQPGVLAGDGRIVMVNTPVLISETCEVLLANGADIACCYFDPDSKSRVYSLRSKDPAGPDVSEIAKKYGGGGHKHAAGFTVPR